MSYYGVSPPPLTSWLNPLAAINNVIQIILYFFAMALFYIAALVNLLLAVMEDVISGTVDTFVQATVGLGPFSLPVFAVLFSAFISFALILAMALHDLPIVGAFA